MDSPGNIGGFPPRSETFYVSHDGVFQYADLKRHTVLRYISGKVEAADLLDDVIRRLEDIPSGSMTATDASTPLREYRPPSIRLLVWSDPGNHWEWLVETAEFDPRLKSVVAQIKTLTNNVHGALGPEPDNNYIRADVPNDKAIGHYKKADLFLLAQESDVKSNPYLEQALTFPARLIAVPADVNPFMPWRGTGKYRPGHDALELEYKDSFFQVRILDVEQPDTTGGGRFSKGEIEEETE